MGEGDSFKFEPWTCTGIRLQYDGFGYGFLGDNVVACMLMLIVATTGYSNFGR